VRSHWKAATRGPRPWCVFATTGRGLTWRTLGGSSSRFVRADEGRARDEGGSGLGLTIVRADR
jgi:hypothetical protein